MYEASKLLSKQLGHERWCTHLAEVIGIAVLKFSATAITRSYRSITSQGSNKIKTMKVPKHAAVKYGTSNSTRTVKNKML